MKQKFIKRSFIDAPLDELFKWHSRKGILERLTPPWNSVKIISQKNGIENNAKTILNIKTGLLKYKWTALHSDYKENYSFRDTQVEGPFAYWSHYHKFTLDSLQKSILEDNINYALPFPPIGKIFLNRFIKKELERTFKYRHIITARDMKTHLFNKDKTALNILISGGSGLIGSALIPFLTTAGHKVIKLVRRAAVNDSEVYWNPEKGSVDFERIGKVDAIINLAGENIGNSRWTEAKKENIIRSRVKSSKLISSMIEHLSPAPKVLLSASAIGYYGERGDVEINEKADSFDSRSDKFISEVCRAWENSVNISFNVKTRIVFMRIGVVMTPAGGALSRILFPFKLGLGFKIGKGSQYISWIGMDDVIGSIYHILYNETLEGPVNIVSPNPITNYEFSKTLAKVLSRPLLFTIPESLIKLFFGRMGEEVLLTSTRVMPEKLLKSGYKFSHCELDGLLKESLGL